MLTNDDLKNLPLEEVVKKATPIIIDYCNSRIKYNFHDAEEMANDVMFRLSRKWNYLYKDGLMMRLYNVANKLISDYWRKKAREEKNRTKNKLEIVYIEDIPSENEPSDEDDYNKFMLNDDILECVEYIYNRLSDELERDLYRYRYIEKKRLLEISEITGIPYSTLYGKYVSLEKKVRALAREAIEESMLY